MHCVLVCQQMISDYFYLFSDLMGLGFSTLWNLEGECLGTESIAGSCENLSRSYGSKTGQNMALLALQCDFA